MLLQRALDDSLIDFDSRVLVTDLLEKYKLTYKEVNDTLEAHIKQQELKCGTKYEKCFLVHGNKAAGNGGAPTEVYTIVQGESKLKEWLRKLQNAQSQLYSVEVAGGSKAPAQIFKPMQHLEVRLAKLEKRAAAATTARPTPAMSNGVHKAPDATMPKRESTSNSNATNGSKMETTEKGKQNEKKESPTEQKKGKAAAAGNKKSSISSFFTAGAAAKAQTKPAKDTKAATNNTMENFFKKQPASEAAKASPKKETAASNTSVQLFDEESSPSSDEEEKLDKLRRTVVASDNESDTEDIKASTSSSKRRRIMDSDDEEQPQKKANEKEIEAKPEPHTEVMDVDAEEDAAAPPAETYLDEDGFVITIKPKKAAQPAKKRASPASAAQTAPASKKKSPPSANKNTAGAKTKQGNIMSFFTKK
ncbi:uncharacterized protein LOC115628993 [Scaptodrosophila lebanonensis]|uniref:Uncharacterized protein LOC115628993 n=1 Tax=Drosophila lebanonensis TaxID=7225 RepID=A0A6J2TYD4_DROLE|nr:uncharacterized protein LOC115628993 [Scaptodrosophila lebanonensis]